MPTISELLAATGQKSNQTQVSPRISFNTNVTVELVAKVMGIEPERLQSLAWLLIQEEAAGVARQFLADELGTGLDEVNELIESVVGVTGEEAQQIWSMGIAAIRTAGVLNDHAISKGWDTVEAIAVTKLANQLAAMPGNGDADQMLRIASTANRSLRRQKGEGGSHGSRRTNDQQGAEMSVILKSGNLGTMSLTFAPAIQEQLNNPNRVIDAVANNAKAAGEKLGGGSMRNLSMLKLDETRELIEAKQVEEKKQTAISLAFDKLFEGLEKSGA